MLSMYTDVAQTYFKCQFGIETDLNLDDILLWGFLKVSIASFL